MKGFAQPKAKDFLLGGSFSGSGGRLQYPDDSGYVERKYTIIHCNLQIGIFIVPRLAIGASFSFSHIGVNENTIREEPTGSKITPTRKFRAIELSRGGFVSYYHPIREKLLWVNTLTYQHGYTGDGISMDSYFSNKTSTLARYGFNSYSITSGMQYFLTPSLCLTANTSLFSLSIAKNRYNFALLNKENLFIIGLNYLIKNE